MEIKNSIQSYAFEEDYISYRQIRSRFGDPEQVASAYLTEMPPEELLEKLNMKKTVVRILAVAAIVVTVIWTAIFVLGYVSFAKDMHGFDTVEIIEITRNEVE